MLLPWLCCTNGLSVRDVGAALSSLWFLVQSCELSKLNIFNSAFPVSEQGICHGLWLAVY